MFPETFEEGKGYFCLLFPLASRMFASRETALRRRSFLRVKIGSAHTCPAFLLRLGEGRTKKQ